MAEEKKSNPSKLINDSEGTTNCWACAIGFLLRKTQSEIKKIIGAMELSGDESRNLGVIQLYLRKLGIQSRLSDRINILDFFVWVDRWNVRSNILIFLERAGGGGHVVNGYFDEDGSFWYHDAQSGRRSRDIIRIAEHIEARYTHFYFIEVMPVVQLGAMFKCLSIDGK